MRSIEYMGSVIVNLKQMEDMETAQRCMYDYGIKDKNTNLLANVLGPVSSVLGLVFLSSTPMSVASAVVGLAATLSSGQENALKDVVYNGYWQMGYNKDEIKLLNNQFDLFEIEFPFLEYPDKNIRFVQGKGRILRAHVRGGNGWVSNPR